MLWMLPSFIKHQEAGPDLKGVSRCGRDDMKACAQTALLLWWTCCKQAGPPQPGCLLLMLIIPFLTDWRCLWCHIHWMPWHWAVVSCVSMQEEYRAEGISWRNIDYIDNTGCINLISKKPTALFHLLDEECKWVALPLWWPCLTGLVSVVHGALQAADFKLQHCRRRHKLLHRGRRTWIFFAACGVQLPARISCSPSLSPQLLLVLRLQKKYSCGSWGLIWP